MYDIFLSYSSSDKSAVEQLASDLESRNFTVWLDKWEIDVGDTITARVQDGLRNSRFIGVWLTEYSVNSSWVNSEWHTMIAKEIVDAEVRVLPLLAENCELPIFLSSKSYADFRESYDNGLRNLVRTLQRKLSRNSPQDRSQITSIAKHTQVFLDEMSTESIPIPNHETIDIVGSLKRLPRSGKFIRLDGMKPKVPIRSVYDHVLSVAHSADHLLPYTGIGISGRERGELGRVIAYHDVCEIFLGDVPQYTPLKDRVIRKANLDAQRRLSRLEKGEPEEITFKFISMFLSGNVRESLLTASNTMREESNVRNALTCFDKLDPIVAIWRYVKYLREKKSLDIDEFIFRTRHFFQNPHVRQNIIENTRDDRFVALVDYLQTEDNFRNYFETDSIDLGRELSIPEVVVREVIEGRILEFVQRRRTYNARKARS